MDRIKSFIKKLEEVAFNASKFLWRWVPVKVKNVPLVDKAKGFVVKDNKSKRDRLIIWALVLVLGYVGWKTFFPAQQKETYARTVVERGGVVSKVTGTGKVTAEDYAALSFGSTGIVQRIAVEVGDMVKPDEFLANLDTTGLQGQVKQAKGSLQAAKASLEKVERGFDVQIAQQQLANAQSSLELSQNTLENTMTSTKQDIISSENQVKISNQSLASAQQQLQNLEASTGQDVIISGIQADKAEEARSNVSQAEQAQRDNADFDMQIASENEVKSQITRQQQLDQQMNALREKALLADNSRSTLTSTKAKADTSLDSAKNQVTQSENQLSLQELQAQQKLEDKPSDIKSVKGQILQSEGTLDQAENVLEKSVIRAPFAGTILSIATKENETYSGTVGPFLQIANLETLRIEVDISETDILQVQDAQKVQIDFDGLPGEIFDGQVVRVDPGPKVVQGVVNYNIMISYPADKRIRLGMTANVEIITGQQDNALYIPIRAILEENNKQYVRVKEGSTYTKREVRLGIQGDSTVEVIEGITEGEAIYY